MDFFAHQDRARASSRRLIVLYLLSVLGVVVTLNAVAAVVWGGVDSGDSTARVRHVERDVGLNLPLHAMVTLGVLTVIGLATLWKQGEINGDGGNVAELLGGRLVSAAPGDLGERRFVNVVEEMSLASGVPMPRIYVLDREAGINAFAAGTRPENAVVAVTRGTLDTLTRDELQGVIAHEFSHILNGDMRLNLRLIALNFGIMAIGYIGLQLLRFSPHAHGSSRRNSKDNSAALILLFAIAMAIVGYVGTLFGKMLQAAVSRQREYLADASAVQFTRNPNGIAGALKRIGGFGSRLATPNAGEASHLFFADGVPGFLDSLFATHPPLDKRIRAIDPTFDGRMIASPAADRGDGALVGQAFLPVSERSSEPDRTGYGSTQAGMPAPLSLRPDDLSAVGPIQPARAGPLVAAIPDEVRAAVRDPFDARAVALALLLDRDPTIRDHQLGAVAAVDEQAAAHAEHYRPLIASAGPAARLPIAELALPALRSLSPSQQVAFRQLCRTLAAADQVLSPFELALFKLIDNALPDASAAGDNGVRFTSVTSIADEAGVLLSVLAMAGGAEQARRAFNAGVARLKPGRVIDFGRAYDGRAFADALATLRLASTPVRRRVVDAAAQVVAIDGVVRIEELELLRAACAAFDVPVPPLAGGGA